MFRDKWRVVSLALLAVIGIIAGAVYAVHPGEAEVRVATMRHDDGRVEVAVQQRDAEGGWAERELPSARFLPPDVTGEWRVSSPVSVSGAGMSTALYCVVHHGADNDPFWNTFNLAVETSARDLGLANVEVHGESALADQSAAIIDCVERGAMAVASSIPDLKGLQDALRAVRNSEAFLFTFNSGANLAAQVGSFVHYGLDDAAAGQVAGEQFNNAGLTGTVLCFKHEEANIGLDERCDGLAASYGGTVQTVNLPAGSLADPLAAGTAIAGAIVEHQAEGVLVLNAQLTTAAIGAATQLGSGAQVGAIGRDQVSLLAILNGHMLFAISDGDIGQATSVVLGLKNLDASEYYRSLLRLAPLAGTSTTLTLMRPAAYDQAYFEALGPTWLEQICRLAGAVDPSLLPEACK